MSFGNRRLATPILATLIDMSVLGMAQAQVTQAPEGKPLAGAAAGAGCSTPTAADVSVTSVQDRALIDTAPRAHISCPIGQSERSPMDEGQQLTIFSRVATADVSSGVAPQGNEKQALAVAQDSWNVTEFSPLRPVTSDPTTMTIVNIMSSLEWGSSLGASTIAARTEGDALIEGLPNGSYSMSVIATDGAVIAAGSTGAPYGLNASPPCSGRYS